MKELELERQTQRKRQSNHQSANGVLQTVESADLIRSDAEMDIWHRSPFEQCLGEFWNPTDPTQRYAGTLHLEMGLPFVEIPLLDRTRMDWKRGVLHGILSNGREVLLLAPEGVTHPTKIYRAETWFERYEAVGALIGEGATALDETSVVQKVTLIVQTLENWMMVSSPPKIEIGTEFYNPMRTPKVTAYVEQEQRRLTVDLGEGKPLRTGLKFLDEAQHLVRKAIGCLSGHPPIARNYTLETPSGTRFEWHYARWEPPLREPISGSMPTYLAGLGPVDTLLNRFAVVERELRPLTSVLFGAMSTPNIYAEHRFMSLLAGIEGAHSNLLGESKKERWTGVQDEEYKKAKALLSGQLDAVPDKEVRDALKTALRIESTLRQKLGDVFDYLDGVVETGLQIDRSRWIKLALDFRNSTAHTATKKLSGGIKETVRWHTDLRQ